MSSEFLDRVSKLSSNRLALLAVELHDQVERANQRSRAPIAVIGMGCRFPGAADPAQFWQLLDEGRDAIGPVPRDRWDIDAYFDPDPDAPGRMSVRHGGFLDRVDGFDPAFFGITPREALTMDPQQRLLLEVAWEALEDAGLAPDRLAGSPAGVFIGICNSDYHHRLLQRGEEAIDAYLASGSAHSVAAGRIAYCLGLEGPALSIDTACSSSLVALHAACQSLRRGESSLALCGGVNVMCSPETTIALSKAHMLAPDGRCKTFDARADGFSRGEGCGVLVLKRLDDALAGRDRVLAVIRGSAVNQDGRSSGLTVPNGPAQETVIRAALADADIAPGDVQYVEAHGTGTSLGDPIEVRALAGALGAGRSADDPLWIGSVKTNIGHLESAAGIAGIIKVVLALQHERMPSHLHFQAPNPHIAWGSYPVAVTSSAREWKRGLTRRIAGVSSFGFSGTNAHAIVEEGPAPAAGKESVAPRHVHCLALSARTPEALASLSARWADALRAPDAPTLASAAHTAGVGRSHMTERVAIVAHDAAEAAAALDATIRGHEHPALVRGRAVPEMPDEPVFLFTGQGAQYPGMALALYESWPIVREVLDRCDALLGSREGGRRLLSVLREDPSTSPIHETCWTQPATFAVQMALVALWKSWGVTPAAVLGHSAGEYAAACAAGVMSLEDGLALITERARLMQSLGPGGAMAAINAGLDVVRHAVARFDGRVAIAAFNGDDAHVISGDEELVAQVCATLGSRGVECKRLVVSLAAHSPRMEAALDALEAAASRPAFAVPQIPVAWNLTGGTPLPGGAPDAGYWRRHLREPVRFAEAVRSLWNEGFRTFVEIGPHPVLLALAQRALFEPAGFVGVASMRRGREESREIAAALATLYAHGARVDWPGVAAPQGARRVAMPTYPFERRRFWIESDTVARRPELAIRATGGNGLFGVRALQTAVPLFETTLRPDAPSWLGEHHVNGVAVAAGPVFLELAQEAARVAGAAVYRNVRDFVIETPLFVHEDGTPVQVQLTKGSQGGLSFRVHARDAADPTSWRLCATGHLVDSVPHQPSAPTLDDADWSKAEVEPVDQFYSGLAKRGIELGPAFRGLRRAHRSEGEALARVELTAALAADAVTWAHPALLDAALQAIGMAIPERRAGADMYLLSGIESVAIPGPLPAALWCQARIAPSSGARTSGWRGDVLLRDDENRVVGWLSGVTVRRTGAATLPRAAASRQDDQLHHAVVWEPAPPRDGTLPTPAALAQDARVRHAALAATHDLASYDVLLPALDALARDYVRAALRALGFADRPGRVLRAEEEAVALGVVPRYHRLFARFVRMLAESGDLQAHQDSWLVMRPLADSAGAAPALPAGLRDASVELSLLRRCGPALADVLRGEQNPLALLFPGGELSEARRLYEESPSARTCNGTIASIVAAAAPGGRRLRVLEIGAGTGGTTVSVLDAATPDSLDYTFTDVSPLFVERAGERFPSHGLIRRAVLDMERDPAIQGFAAASYDVVIAANVLHATADLPRSLRYARSLLAPGGLLVLLEGLVPEPWVDLTFGLTDGWWRFADPVRHDYPLVSEATWRSLLNDCGFEDPQVVGGASAPGRGAQQGVILARRPRAAEARRMVEWTIVADRAGVAPALARALALRGDTARVVNAAGTDGVHGHMVYLAALDAADPDTAITLAGSRALEWLGRHTRAASTSRVWLVTAGAQPAADSESATGRWQSPLWGLGRVFALEQPASWGGLIDLPVGASTESAAALIVSSLEAALDGDDEDQLAWRDGVRFAPRLVPAPPPEGVLPIHDDAAYLITGGFGGLGTVVAQWLRERGARTIALLGRRPDVDSEAVRALEATGARILTLAADVADEAAMQAQLARFGTEFPPIGGIVHAAATFSTAPIGELADADVEATMRPKVHGTATLERLTRERPPEWMVLFSSTTALLGASGLAHYAAANAFLDASARAARRAGRAVTSVNWGTWEVMRLASGETQRTYRQVGFDPMPVDEACEAMAAMVGAGRAEGVVARINWATLKPLHEARRRRPLLARIGAFLPAAPRAAAMPACPTSTLATRLASLPPATRVEALTAFVSREVATVLGIESAVVPTDVGLFDLGMDSLMSVELRKRLECRSGLALPSTLTFNCPTVAALVAFLNQELHGAGPAATLVGALTMAGAVREEELAAGSDVSALTDAELEARLLAHLEALR